MLKCTNRCPAGQFGSKQNEHAEFVLLRQLNAQAQAARWEGMRAKTGAIHLGAMQKPEQSE
jgi:hypothetical protein